VITRIRFGYRTRRFPARRRPGRTRRNTRSAMGTITPMISRWNSPSATAPRMPGVIADDRTAPAIAGLAASGVVSEWA
jgi:hypothetical protein